MDLGRRKIREEFENRLKALDSNVFHRLRGLNQREKKCVFLDIPEQSFEIFAQDPRIYTVFSTVQVSGFLWEKEDLTEELDEFLTEVISCLNGFTFDNVALKDVESFSSDETERMMGGFACTYVIRHRVYDEVKNGEQEEFKAVKWI